MREYSATAGATDGNIIAAIITTHAPTNQPNVPRPVQGPSSMPSIRSIVAHQPMPARANSSATSASRDRAGATPARPLTGSGAEAIIGGADFPARGRVRQPGRRSGGGVRVAAVARVLVEPQQHRDQHAREHSGVLDLEQRV